MLSQLLFIGMQLAINNKVLCYQWAAFFSVLSGKQSNDGSYHYWHFRLVELCMISGVGGFIWVSDKS